MPLKKDSVSKSALRHRKYLQKIKNDPEAHAKYLQKQKEKYEERKRKGGIKSIKEKSDREKRKQRKYWRINQRNSRAAREKQTELTPPVTPDADRPIKRRGRPRIRDPLRSKAYRKITNLENAIKTKDRAISRLKKRYQRIKIKVSSNAQSPNSKTKALMGSAFTRPGQQKAKRALIFHNVLIGEMRKLKSNKGGQKKLLQALRLQVLKKYRLAKTMRESTGVSRRLQQNPFHRKQRLVEKSKGMRAAVNVFLQRDDNSRMSSCKKDHVNSKQVRYLLHSLKILHKKYLSESELKVSHSFFCRNRPVHVRKPTLKDREVCVCKQCENFTLKLEVLFREKIVTSKDPADFIASLVCDTINQDCMYSDCNKCHRKATIRHGDHTDYLDKVVHWWEWNNVNHSYTSKSGGVISTKRVQKVRKTSSLKCLIATTNKYICSMMKHLYRVYHQYAAIASLKEHLDDESALLHFDFSENWNCKYARETTDVHFGASQQQATLHTGLIYTAQESKGFCSVSTSNLHDAAGVWAHLKSTLEYVRDKYPNVSKLHLLSDSPSSQYRNKSSFYLLCKIPQAMGFQSVTWNYLESGHGKGAADGIGAAVKRSADQFVANGMDIPDPTVLYHKLIQDGSSIKFIFVSQEDVDKMAKTLPSNDNLKAFPGTMSCHQVWPEAPSSPSPSTVLLREFSCYCSIDANRHCDCYRPKKWCLEKQQQQVQELSVAVEQQGSSIQATAPIHANLASPGVECKTRKKPKPTRNIKHKTANRQQKSSDYDDDAQCLVCDETYNSSAPGETWIQCVSCKRWAHELCTSFEPELSNDYTCDVCE